MSSGEYSKPVDDLPDDAIASLRHLNRHPIGTWFGVSVYSSVARGAAELVRLGGLVELRTTATCVHLRRLGRNWPVREREVTRG